MPRVALMSFEGALWDRWTAAFRDGMLELGYVEGENVLIETVPADTEDLDATLSLIETLRQNRVDVIVSAVLPHHIPAVARAAEPIPMVEPLLNTPNVGAPPIASYARPGSNVTGIIAIDPGTHARRLQLLKEVAPTISRVIVLTPWDRPDDLPGWKEIVDAAGALKIEVERVQPSGPDDIEPAIEAAIHRGADGLLQYQGNPFAATIVQQRVVGVMAKHRLPSVHIAESWAGHGALMSYAPSTTANYRRAAMYVDRILKGAAAGDLPVEYPTSFTFIINLHTATTLGLTIPRSVLAQASELIQ